MVNLIIAAVIAICVYGVLLQPSLRKNLEGPLGSRIRRISCAVGRHERSRRKVKKVDGGYTSCCKYCGVVMARKHGSKRWSTDIVGIIAPIAHAEAGQAREAFAEDDDGSDSSGR